MHAAHEPGRCEIFSFYKKNEGNAKSESEFELVFEIRVYTDRLEYTNRLGSSQQRLKRRGWHFDSRPKKPLNDEIMNKVREDADFRKDLLQAVLTELSKYEGTLKTRKKGPLGMFEVRKNTSKQSVIDEIRAIGEGNTLKLTQKMADIVHYGTNEKAALRTAFATVASNFNIPVISKSREILEVLEAVSGFAELDYPKQRLRASFLE